MDMQNASNVNQDLFGHVPAVCSNFPTEAERAGTDDRKMMSFMSDEPEAIPVTSATSTSMADVSMDDDNAPPTSTSYSDIADHITNAVVKIEEEDVGFFFVLWVWYTSFSWF